LDEYNRKDEKETEKREQGQADSKKIRIGRMKMKREGGNIENKKTEEVKKRGKENQPPHTLRQTPTHTPGP
jgi:hypothetical protein